MEKKLEVQDYTTVIKIIYGILIGDPPEDMSTNQMLKAIIHRLTDILIDRLLPF
jgi:hypothetical protein